VAKKKILMIDDAVDLVTLLKMRLEFHDYAVVPLYTSKRALEIAQREEPDLILLDIMMPDMDGYEVCRRLKTDEKTKNTPIILFTAQSSQLKKMAEEYKKIGADDYIAKPFEPEVLLRKVKEIIGQ
jgi:DNA-binding response OmpR family regulator